MLEIKRKLKILTIIALVLFSVLGYKEKMAICNAPNEINDTKYVTQENGLIHRNRIRRIHNTDDWISYDMLFLSEEFIEIYENPKKYKSASIQLINEIDLTSMEKKIIVLSMQKLKRSDYLDFINNISLKEFELIELAMLGFSENHHVSENFFCKDVRTFLKGVRSSNLSSEGTKDLALEIMFGRVFIENKISKFLK